ncbi:MAG: hypothetical protein EBU75_12115 [Betaproteobacteria bacterium]|nr:hypothetical protein [Betaproteobacteria bacterium]
MRSARDICLNISPPMRLGAPYDPVRDFTPVSSLIIASFVMVVGPASPANSLADFVKLVSASPGTFPRGPV